MLVVGALALLLSPQVVVRAYNITSFSARQLNVYNFPANYFEKDSRFLTGGAVYQVHFDREFDRDFTIVWPGTSFTTISLDDALVELDVYRCTECQVHSYTRAANGPWQVTLPGAIKYVRVQVSARITFLHRNGTKAGWSKYLDFSNIRPTTGYSNAAIISLSGQYVEIKGVSTPLNYTCQWAAKTQVEGVVDGPSSSLMSTVLQAPLEYRGWGWGCEVPLGLDDRAPGLAHFTMSLLVGSGPDTVPPADGVPIVKPTRPRVLSIPSTANCLLPGSILHVIGVFNTSALYSCDFGMVTGLDSIDVIASSQPESPQSHWDLLCKIPTELTRDQFILLRKVTVRQWPDAGARDSERLPLGSCFFYSYCPAVFWYYSSTFWYEVGAAVGVLALVVFAAVAIMRRRRSRAYAVVSLDMASV